MDNEPVVKSGMSVLDKIARARVKLLKTKPFFAGFLRNYPIVEAQGIPTACTDAVYIYYADKLFDGLTAKEVTFVILHELYHILLKHCIPNPKASHLVLNWAHDFVINGMIAQEFSSVRDSGTISIPDWVLSLDSNCRNYSSGQLYDIIYPQYKDQEDNKTYKSITCVNIKSENGEEYVKAGYKIYDIIIDGKHYKLNDEFQDVKLNSDRTLPDKIRKSVSDATMTAKMMHGTVPGSLIDILEELHGKKLPWDLLAKRFLTSALDDETSFSSPDKRYMPLGLTLPGQSVADIELSGLLAVVDTSASISKDQLSQFIKQLKDLCNLYEIDGWLFYFDVGVQSYGKIKNFASIKRVDVKGNGGTDFNLYREFVLKNRIHYNLQVVLTDGYFETAKYMKNTIWVISENPRFKAPYGKVAHL